MNVLAAALASKLVQLGKLLSANVGVVDLQNVDGLIFGQPVLVHTDHSLLPRVDPSLRAGRGFLDPELRDSGLDGRGHAAHHFDFADVVPSLLSQLIGKALDVIAAAPGVDRLGCAGFVLEEQLRVAGDPGGEVGGQRQRFVECVGVQRLGVTLGCRRGLDAGADHVVVNVLRGEAPAARLTVGTEA